MTVTMEINDTDEVLILTKEPMSIVNCDIARSETNEENKYDIVDLTNDNENFSWFEEFTSSVCSVVGNANYELFEYLLSIYQKRISKDFYNWQFLQPPKFAKLKNHIRNTLTFFHFCWRNIKERVSDDYTYLDKMAEIVRIYLDLEVTSSVKDNDSFDKLSSKILHALHIYLDNSEEHVLKILLKSTCVTEKYSKIYNPIFEKYFSNLRNCGEAITNFTYARYLLAFKLWKTIIQNREEKAIITSMALTKLGPSMPKMGPELSKFIPEPPEGHQSGTLWLMESNLFDFRKACDDFLSLEEKMHSFSFSEEFEEINLKSCNASGLQLDLENYFNQKTHPEIDKISKKKPVRKRVFPKLKPGDRNLTSDRKIKKKQQWLKEAKIHRKFKKPQPLSNRPKLVEVADAHSTESCENFEKSDSEAACSLRQDVHSSTTYVTSVCDKLRTSVLHSESRNIFNYGNYVIEDISSRSGKELPINWDNRYDKTEICPVSTTVGDHVSEASSGTWTDYNSADSEAPDAIASASSEISTNLWKLPQEEVCEEYNVFSTSLFEGSLGATGIPNSLLDYNLMGSDSFMSDFVYSNFQAIDPNVLRKSPDKFDFKITNSFSEDPPPIFENEERIEMNDKFERMEDSPTLIKFDAEVNEERTEAIEKSIKGEEQMKEEISSTSRKILKNSVVCRNLIEKGSSEGGKRSKKSLSLSPDTEDLFRTESGVQLPFKKRFYANEEENLSVVNKDV